MTGRARRNRCSRRGLLAALLFVGCVLAGVVASAPEAQAQPRIVPGVTGQRVDEVRVVGNRRANLDEILYNIRQKSGDPLDLETVSADIKRIFRMGFFEDVQVDADEVDGRLVLTYYVAEKPAVLAVRFQGADELDEETLAEQVDIAVPSILDLAKVRQNAEKLRAYYVKEGYYLAEVREEILPLADGDVEVVYQIREFAKVSVVEINIVGNEAISDEELKGNIFTRESSLLGFLSGAGEFNEDEFKKDLQRLVFFYADQGYPNARISDPQIQLSEDRRSMFITLRIEEGELFHVEDVALAGDLDVASEEELQALLEVKAGEEFRLSRIFQDVQALSNYYKDLGYAYVSVEPKRRMDPDARTIGVVYDINKGKKVRIGRISITGNQKTADKVIRRELLINEGEVYSGTLVQASERSVLRLGFFEKVSVRQTSSKTSDEYLDILVEVTERPTGTFQVGAGFSSVESFIATIQVSQDNFLGRGQSLVAQATFSGLRQLFNVQFFDPYFLDSNWRFRATVFNFEYLFTDFTRASTGGTLGFGYPLLRELVLDLTYTIENVDVSPGGRLGRQRRNVGSLFTGGLTSSVGATLAWDTRDNRLFPTDGWIYQIGAEVADNFLGSDNEFTRVTFRARQYFPLFFDFVLRFNLELGLISNWNAEGKPVPVFERFFVGGPNSVRGFERSTLGPTRSIAADASDPASPLTDFHIGGDKQLIFNAEIEFPILTSVGIKGVVFFDAGNAFDNNQSLSLVPDFFADEDDYADVLRTAVGLGFRWLSPIGPLRFEWGFPLAPTADEEDYVFEFSIGNAF